MLRRAAPLPRRGEHNSPAPAVNVFTAEGIRSEYESPRLPLPLPARFQKERGPDSSSRRGRKARKTHDTSGVHETYPGPPFGPECFMKVGWLVEKFIKRASYGREDSEACPHYPAVLLPRFSGKWRRHSDRRLPLQCQLPQDIFAALCFPLDTTVRLGFRDADPRNFCAERDVAQLQWNSWTANCLPQLTLDGRKRL